MSEEPARPDEVVGGAEEGEAPPQTDQPAEPTNVEDLAAEMATEIAEEMAAKPPEKTDPNPVETKTEAAEGESKPSPEKAAQQILNEPSVKAAVFKPADAASEFPLADSGVLAELKAGETRAREAAKAIEALKEQLAASAKKDVMTEEDIKMMEQKQKELMEKMQEFEDITKKIQQLVGLVDVASSQLGPPQKPMVPLVEGAKTKEPSKPSKGLPMDTLPKVIICGTSDIDEVPKIIVCEPTSARNGKQPLYQQIKNDTTNGKTSSKIKVVDTVGPSNHDQTGKYVSLQTNPPQCMYPGYQGYPGGLPGQGAMGFVRPFGDGSHMGMMQPGMGQAGMTQPGVMYPGMGQAAMTYPGMGQAAMMYPGMGNAGMMQPGMGQQSRLQPWMAQPGMTQYGAMQPGMAQFGMAQPGGQMMPGFCSPCGHPRKQKGHRKNSNGGNVESGLKTDRTKKDESVLKKICRKRKQCYCQISGLCQFNKPPYPTT